MIKLSKIALGKVDFTKTNQTTRVPRTAIQTFQIENKNDYTTIVRENKYSAQIDALNNKFASIEPQEYINEAAANGFKTLTVSDADYESYGAKWDKIAS